MAEKNKIHLSKFTVHDLKLKAGPNGKHSVDDMMEFITEKYPVLKREYIKERNNLNPYYLKMFESITAALISEKNDSIFAISGKIGKGIQLKKFHGS